MVKSVCFPNFTINIPRRQLKHLLMSLKTEFSMIIYIGMGIQRILKPMFLNKTACLHFVKGV